MFMNYESVYYKQYVSTKSIIIIKSLLLIIHYNSVENVPYRNPI